MGRMQMNRVQGFGSRLAAAACVTFVLAGCTSGLGGDIGGHQSSSPASSPVEPTFKLDGLYKIVEDGTGTRNGVPVNDQSKIETEWAFRTACDTDGCVAEGGTVDPNNPSAPPELTKVIDYVDGKWSSVFIEQGAECPRATGEMFKSDQWSIWDITQAPDNKLLLKIAQVGADECNFNTEITPSLTRVGDLPPNTTLPNPADAPKRMKSFPAKSFRGKYAVDYTVAASGESQGKENMDVKTYCLRAEERCVTTTVNIDPRDPGTKYGLVVYEFRANEFSFNQTVGKKPCSEGTQGEGVFSKKATLSLPPAPVPDPLDTLTGKLDVTVTGDCPDTAAYNVTFTRTGD
jgi:serine/threonine-protein kinase